MALTVKELGDELDSLSAKVDSTADKFTDKLDALSKNQNSTSVAVASLQADAASLKQVIADASLNSLHGDVVSLKTTVANAKLIGVMGTSFAFDEQAGTIVTHDPINRVLARCLWTISFRFQYPECATKVCR